MFYRKTIPKKHKPDQNDLRKDWKISSYFGGTETVVWNRCSYQVPGMVVTNTSTRKNTSFQLNSAGHFNRRRRLRHEGQIPVCPFVGI